MSAERPDPGTSWVGGALGGGAPRLPQEERAAGFCWSGELGRSGALGRWGRQWLWTWALAAGSYCAPLSLGFRVCICRVEVVTAPRSPLPRVALHPGKARGLAHGRGSVRASRRQQGRPAVANPRSPPAAPAQAPPRSSFQTWAVHLSSLSHLGRPARAPSFH